MILAVDATDLWTATTPAQGPLQLESDRVLISRIRAGNREAMTILYERYMPSIWRYAFSRLVGDDAAARDVVSETFLAVLQSLSRPGAAPDDVAKWLSGVARHKLADHWRRSAAQVTEQDVELPERQVDPAEAMDALELRQTVGQAMDRMDDQQRFALEWKYLDGLTVREIAGRLGRTEKAIEGILNRARVAFRAQYKRIARQTQGDHHDYT